MGWSRFLHRSRWDDERAKELADYLDHEIDDNLARGMSRQEAARAARLKLGNPTRIREEIYDMNSLRFVETVWQDLRFGLRLLVKNPTFSIVAVATLALGTGANAAIFQLMNSLRMRALPVERPQELVSIGIDTHEGQRIGRFMSRRPFFSDPLWQTIRAEQQAFSDVFAWGIAAWNIATDGEYRPVEGLFVSGSFFRGLHVTPQIGRLIAEADDTPGCGAPGAVLAHGFWQARFGGRTDAIGRQIVLDGRPFDIIGVTPPQFFGTEVGRKFDVAVPLCAEPLFRGEQSALGKPDHWFLDVMARLKPGWTAERAQAQLESSSPVIFAATVPPTYDPEAAGKYRAFTLTATSAGTGVSGVRGTYETQLWVLLGATGFIVLIACANLANLMLARATAREREIAVRLSIGASRSRVVRQMLAESFLIAGLGAAAGAVLALRVSEWLVRFVSTENVQLFVDLTPDWRLFGFMAGLAVLACLLCGLSPALTTTSTNLIQLVHAGGRSSTDSRRRFTLRRGLVVVQVALSMVLVVGAVLFVRSLDNLLELDPGFRQDGILAVSVDVRRSAIDGEARRFTYTTVADRVRAVPGVIGGAEAYIVPMSGSAWNQTILIDGEKKQGIVNFNEVGTDYFGVMQTPLLAGRTFDVRDRLGAPETAIVNETFARKYFGGGSPIGRTFQIDEPPGQPRPQYRIVGLVKDTKYTNLREEFTPIAYRPFLQATELEPRLSIVVRSDVPLSSLRPALTEAIRQAAPGATVAYDTLRTYVHDSLVTERLMAWLSGFLGALAALIASVGLYGVMAFSVSRRKVEIGVRMALGADRGTVVRMMLAECALLLAFGVGAGAALALLASRLAANLLFGLTPADPASFAAAVGGLGAVSLVAAWIPARRASRLAPTVALRE